MQLNNVIFYVEDLPATLQFYKEAFGLSPKMVHESGHYAELETGAVILGFATLTFIAKQFGFQPEPGSLKHHPMPQQISFKVFDVAASYEQAVQAGAMSVFTPQLMPWGYYVAFVRDLNGFLVELCRKA